MYKICFQIEENGELGLVLKNPKGAIPPPIEISRAQAEFITAISGVLRSAGSDDLGRATIVDGLDIAYNKLKGVFTKYGYIGEKWVQPWSHLNGSRPLVTGHYLFREQNA